MEGKPPAKTKAKPPRGRPFAKGQSGNPGGRPKGLAAYVRALTSDNQEQADFFYRISRSLWQDTPEALRIPSATLADVMEAHKWLADRGSGKPVQALEGADGEALQVVFNINRGGKG